MRLSNCEVEMNGRTFPKNTSFLTALHCLHLSPEYFPEPEKFKPDRWIDNTSLYLPFGDGPHNCPGQKMALIEMKVVLVHLLAKFRLSMKPQELVFVQSITRGLKNGLWIDFESRNELTSQ